MFWQHTAVVRCRRFDPAVGVRHVFRKAPSLRGIDKEVKRLKRYRVEEVQVRGITAPDRIVVHVGGYTINIRTVIALLIISSATVEN